MRRATKTFVRKPRRLKDGGLGPDTPSGKGLREGTSDLLNQEMVLSSLACREGALKVGQQPAAWGVAGRLHLPRWQGHLRVF